MNSPSALVEHIVSAASSGSQPRPAASGMSYVVLQVVLKEKLLGTGSGNLTELEKAINAQAALGYRLHTITTAASGSKGITVVFLASEKAGYLTATTVFVDGRIRRAARRPLTMSALS